LKTSITVEPETLAPFFAVLVDRIERGSQDAIHELQLHFLRGIRYLLARHLGRDRADYLAQNVMADVVDAIQNGEVRDPEHLPAFVQTTVRHTIALALDYLPSQPASTPVPREDVASAKRILRSLPARDREILVRFYSQEQPPEKICREMGVSAVEFLLIKKRARDKFVRPSTGEKNI